MGRMWHQTADGRIWYFTIPLAPLKYDLPDPNPSGIDLTAEIKPDGFYNVLPGTEVSGTARFGLTIITPEEEAAEKPEPEAQKPEPVKATITLHHKIGNDKQSVQSIYAGTKEFEPGKEFSVPFKVIAPTKDSYIIAEIQPVEMTDSTPDNNIARATISIAGVDFTADIEPDSFYDTLPGTRVSGTATFKLTTGIPAEARITLHHKIGDNKWPMHTETRKFKPREVLNIQFNTTASTEDSHIIARIQPVEMTDLTPDNNIARATIFVEPPVVITIPPMGDIPLILTTEPRVSERTGRPLGTRLPDRPGWTNARWTDRITARIEPPPPPPPEISGLIRNVRITDWWISSATLYRPKTHPEATYGHYPPWMQELTMNLDESIPMLIDDTGEEAEVTFTQNWSIAGAPMRDVITGRMIARAAEYPVKVEFTITYEYEYEELTEDGWVTRTGRGETTGEAHGLVFVDGVGTVIIAN
ncbi:hypothetical protein M1M96_00035 [Peptococcaceae bacterium]|nr:hypothetical protein [Peptococcaceae bacterium]